MLFSSRVAIPVLGALFSSVLLVMPREAGLDLGDVDVAAVQQHLPHEASVLVTFEPFNHDRAAGDLVSEVLPRDSTEGLVELRGVNASKADSVLAPSSIKHSDGVAIVDGYHLAFKERGVNNDVKAQRKQQAKESRDPLSFELWATGSSLVRRFRAIVHFPYRTAAPLPP
jgi:hypothetical protein